jgi:hypothetical protein
MKRAVVVVITLVLTVLPAAAATASASPGNVGFDAGGSLPSTSAGSPFATLVADAPIRYERIGVTWDEFGTSTRSRCVAPTQTNSAPSTTTGDITRAEQLGEMPLLQIGPDAFGATNGYQWPAGAQTGTTPNDREYKCGVQLLLKALKSQGLARTGMPVEAFNEPDNSYYYVSSSQAAHYFGDLVATGGSQVHAIAGAFESPYDDNNGYITQDPTYATDYVSTLKSSGYNSSATSWSFHDYNDTTDATTIQYCSPTDLSACNHQGVSHFISWLQSQGEPTTDVWITEAGDASVGGAWLTHSRSEEANTAYGWEQLRSYAQHVFWYEWQTFSGDGWDSAIVDASGQPRPSYCVIAFNETPSQALADSRCPGG